MINFCTLRKKNYEYRKNLGDFDNNFLKNSPYTYLKAKLYIELSTILTFLIQFTSLTPNHISLVYALSGIFGGVLISTDINSLIIIGLFIFYFKNSLDWTDGFYAKIKNEKSIVGHILDTWGSHIGHISLIIGIGIYCYNTFEKDIYLILTILILFLNLINLKFFAYYQLFHEVLSDNLTIKSNKNLKISQKKSLLHNFLINFMDHRARTVDFVCLLIFLEILYSLNWFSEVIFALYGIQSIIFFFGHFYLVYFKREIQKKIND